MGKDSPCRIRLACAACLVGALQPATAKAAVTLIFDQADAAIAVVGDIGVDGSFQRSFQLRADGGDAQIRFLPSDLTLPNGTLIDRRNVTVTGDAQIGVQPKNYLLAVTGVAVAGEYSGHVDVLSQNASDHAAHIPVKLVARARPTVTLASETLSFKANVASACKRTKEFTEAVLGRASCQPTHSVFLRASGADMPSRADLELLVVDQNSQMFPQAAVKRLVLVGNQVVLELDLSTLGAGHYTGKIVAKFPDLSGPLDIPVDLQVRIGPIWPLVFIVFGVLVGWLAKVMRDRGDQQADLRHRYNRIAARIAALPAPSRNVLQFVQNRADTAINQAAATDAATAVTGLEQATQILEQLELYRTHPNFAQANGAAAPHRDAVILANIDIGNVDDAKTVLDAIKTNLVQPPAAVAVAAGAPPRQPGRLLRGLLRARSLRPKPLGTSSCSTWHGRCSELSCC